MPGLSRFSARARSVLARRSDVGGPGRRADWSRPAVWTPSAAVTQRDCSRQESWAQAATRLRLRRGHRSERSSGLNPHSRCPPSSLKRPAGRDKSGSSCPAAYGDRRRRHLRPAKVHPRYICALTCNSPAAKRDRRPGQGKLARGRPHAGCAADGGIVSGPRRQHAGTAPSGPGRPQNAGVHHRRPGWRGPLRGVQEAASRAGGRPGALG